MELIIKQEFFNPLFINFTIPNVNRPTFFNITYNSPTVELEGLLFETPWMRCPRSPFQYDINDNNKFHMELSFRGYKFNSQLRMFFSCLSGIDRKISSFLYKNRNYLGLNDNVENLFHKQVRFIRDANSENDSIIKLKLFKSATKTFLTENDNEMDFNKVILPDTRVKAYIKCNGLWYYNGKFGISWKAYKLVVDHQTLPNPENIQNDKSDDKSDDDSEIPHFTFIMDEDDDNENNTSSDEEINDNIPMLESNLSDMELSKSPMDLPQSVGSIAEENECILSKFS